ncbi:hypothetical protein D3C75_1195410 [compost metagenome]
MAYVTEAEHIAHDPFSFWHHTLTDKSVFRVLLDADDPRCSLAASERQAADARAQINNRTATTDLN